MRTLLVIIIFAILILKTNAQNVYTYAGTGIAGYTGDGGPALMAEMRGSTGIFVDTTGDVYFADQKNHCIRKVDAFGIISTIAGTGVSGFSGDGGLATLAQLNEPIDVVIGPGRCIYLADGANQVIRKIDINGIITVVAGMVGQGSFSGDNGPATSARLYNPTSVNFDSIGNMYIADWTNDRIRKVDLAGIITTIAGFSNGGYNGDGIPATSALLSDPASIEFDKSGNMYIADMTNNRIRKIDQNGIITTVAGNGTIGFAGDGGPASGAMLNYPTDITTDTFGNVYFVDSGNRRIRRIDLSGTITTVAGTGVAAYNGEGVAATATQIEPWGLSFDTVGNLYFTDWSNYRVRVICNASCPVGVEETYKADKVNIYPNPASEILYMEIKLADAVLEITDIVGNTIQQQKLISEKTSIDVRDLQSGIYFVQVKTTEGVSTRKIIIQK